MALPDSYTLKPGSIPAYFEAMLNAEAPERFTTRFLESLEFKSTNDRLFINVLKDLGFIDTDGVPKDRYYEFLDRTQAAKVVAEGVREAFSDLFAVNKNAQELTADDVRNKLRTLYKGAKKDNLINRIASTFAALCEYADFSATSPKVEPKKKEQQADLESSATKPPREELSTKQTLGPSRWMRFSTTSTSCFRRVETSPSTTRSSRASEITWALENERTVHFRLSGHSY